MPADVDGHVLGAGDVELPRHGRVQLARLEGAVAGAVKDRADLESAEQIGQAVPVFPFERDHALAGQPPGLARTEAEDTAGVARLKGQEGVVAGDAGDTRHQQRQAVAEIGPHGHRLRAKRSKARAKQWRARAGSCRGPSSRMKACSPLNSCQVKSTFASCRAW